MPLQYSVLFHRYTCEKPGGGCWIVISLSSCWKNILFNETLEATNAINLSYQNNSIIKNRSSYFWRPFCGKLLSIVDMNVPFQTRTSFFLNRFLEARKNYVVQVCCRSPHWEGRSFSYVSQCSRSITIFPQLGKVAKRLSQKTFPWKDDISKKRIRIVHANCSEINVCTSKITWKFREKLSIPILIFDFDQPTQNCEELTRDWGSWKFFEGVDSRPTGSADLEIFVEKAFSIIRRTNMSKIQVCRQNSPLWKECSTRPLNRPLERHERKIG